MTRELGCLLFFALLCLPAAAASAHHLHCIPITDSRYEPLTLAEFFPEDPEAPLFQWVVYSGDDKFSNFSPDG